MRKFFRGALALAAFGFGYLAYVYLTLPDVRVLATTNPETTAFMELRIREAEAEGRKFQIRHRWVPYTQISNNLRRAVIVAEDSAFFDHEGLDLEQIRASLEVNWEEGHFLRGGSTITQQLAKNLYLSPSRNPIRKLRELFITRRLEAALTKRRILEIYLNSIEWGDGIFGCEAASRAYFGKPASALSPAEAALLAGAIINPREHSPARPTRRLLRRQQIIQRRMNLREPPRGPIEAGLPPAEIDRTPPPPPPSPAGQQPPPAPDAPPVPVNRPPAVPVQPLQPGSAEPENLRNFEGFHVQDRRTWGKVPLRS